MTPYSIVAVGTSWGGLSAMGKLFSDLPADFPIPIVVVQHRGKDSDMLLSQLLQDSTELKVCEVEDKDALEAGTIHVAPANYHLMLEPGHVSLTIEEPVRFSRPSIDVMFDSVADSYGDKAIGVVLTGANNDGARGLAHIVLRGGRALIQDPKTAEVPTMPEAAIHAVPSAEVLPLKAMARRLVQLSHEDATKRAGRRTTV